VPACAFDLSSLWSVHLGCLSLQSTDGAQWRRYWAPAPPCLL
jgi:hypothetical protein